MPLATLLKFPETEREANVFAFEHAMAHRTLMSAFAEVIKVETTIPPPPPPPVLPPTVVTTYPTRLTPLSDFSVLPYLLDPMQNTNIPGSKWHMNHQQAHNDFAAALPSPFGVIPTPPGVLPGQILIDSALDMQGSQQWWTFSNHTEHLFALYALNWLTEFNYPSW